MRKYSKYKASGVEWLSEVPIDWEIWKMKFLTRIETGNKNTDDAEENGEYPFYVRSDKVERLSTYSFDGEAILTAGDGVGVAKVFHYANCKMAIHQRVYKIFNFKHILGAFLYYYIKDNFYKEVIKLSAKTTVDSLRMPMLGNFPVAFPSINEQLYIVRFLDYKTGQIDRFIANRQKQIELLKEQKAGIINKAVTKGINPNAIMKDSGMEWIGEVVKEWQLQKLKYLCKHISISAFSKEQDETYIALENIESWTGKFLFNQDFSGFDSTVKKFTDEDILFGKLRPYLAKVAIPEFKGVCVSEILVLRPIKLLREYLYFILLNADFIDFVSQTAEGTKMPRTSWNKIADLKFPFPPKDVQKEILDFIKTETSTVDTLISKYQKQIDLMQEYRTSLISQAVTGKIDVREWEPKREAV